jgi:hypothetical protein
VNHMRSTNIFILSSLTKSYILNNTTVKGWETLPKLLVRRSHHALVNLEGQLYSVGGYNDTEQLDSVERYIHFSLTFSNVINYIFRIVDMIHEQINGNSFPHCLDAYNRQPRLLLVITYVSALSLSLSL